MSCPLLLAPVCSVSSDYSLSAVLSTSDNSSRDPFEPWVCHGHFTLVLPWSDCRRTACSCWKPFVPGEGCQPASAFVNLWHAADVARKNLEELVAHLFSGTFWENSSFLITQPATMQQSVCHWTLNFSLFSYPWLVVEDRKDIFCKLKLMVMKKVLMLPLCISFFSALPFCFFLKEYFPNLFQLLNATFNFNYTPWCKVQKE